MVPTAAGGRFAPGRPRAHRGGEPGGLAHTLAPFRDRARGPRPSGRGPRMLWSVSSRATRPRPERFAISSACWHRPWKHRKCFGMNDSSNLRASYAISRRNCDRIEGSPPRTLLRSAALNVSWHSTSGVGVNTPNHARCSWTPSSFWRGGGTAPMTWMSCRRTRVFSSILRSSPRTSSETTRRWSGSSAEEALEHLVHEPQNLQVILSIDEVRRTIAGLFVRRGQDESRRRLLESHIGMLERLSERAGSDPAIGLLAALARVELAPDQSASAKIRAAMARFPADRRLPQRLVDILAVWIARDIEPYPSDPKSTGKPQGRLDPDVHARAVVLALDSRCEALGVCPALLPAAAMQVCGAGVGRAAEQRKAGRLDDARWTAASLFDFGTVLVRRDPNGAAFHVVLCEAFDQEGKNAWKVNDFPTIEAATRNALLAACTAFRLDPRNTAAQIRSRVSRTRWSV